MAERTLRVLAGIGLGLAVVTALIAGLALSVPTVETATNETRAVPVVAGDDLESLHAAGITGESVDVGVVAVTGHNDHGTAAASLVARTAPDADFHLATFDTPTEYRRAVGWFLERDVDVIVAPVSFYGTPGDGTAPVARAAARASAADTTFVAPVGNLARGHWDGRYDDVRDGKLAFEDGTRNYIRSEAGRELTLWLSWDRAHADENYSASLYWTNGSRTQLIARSRSYEGDETPNQRLSVQLEGGNYFVVVRGPDEATGARLELVSPTHRFQYTDPSGSIAAPATGDDVLAVGAYDLRRDRPEPFSARGPTADGRVGVDVVAPDRLEAATRPDGFVGSSAAAPYVGGLAALVYDVAPDRSPAAVERVVEASAHDVGPEGVDTHTGHGLVRPAATIANVSNLSDR